MSNLDFEDFDRYLLAQKGRIIHQVWFGTIPNRGEARKAYEKLKPYRDSWKIKNPTWCHVEWNKKLSETLIRTLYPEHEELYRKYPYEIQRCDVVRYFILHRYGGLYADMDYYCVKPFDEALQKYTNDFYLVETPNAVGHSEHVSNSLMYSRAGHPFWKYLFLQLEIYKECPYYYTRHLIIMFTTGPGILNRVYSRRKFKCRLASFPYRQFHPYGIGDDILSLNGRSGVYAVHLGKGSWETRDSKWLLFFYQEWKFLLFMLLVLSFNVFIQNHHK